ncbi:phosphatidate cytidylyltransferase [Aquimarina sp. ERC-38]|uniref:phosphatidate cytidylyltransferase n=1 Tax=Aquimarina sp. ERC-38 TaxID=2949996 RepID=UPI0022459F11|nr:phosphatidate cytidylyltransferase [Aquimarina sp. ERC-38]UZO80561.1 phosphatidate cytidylyltransferase [Aquimarina sp. ERC-38]
MKEIHIRFLSGVLYVSLVLTAIFLSPYTFIGLYFLLGIISIWEFQKLIHLKSYVNYAVFVLLLIAFHLFTIPIYVKLLILIITITTQLFLLKDLVTIRIIPMYEKRKYMTTIFFLITSFVFLSLLPFTGKDYDPILITGPLFLIWTNDSFAYLIGKNFGKRKLLERISPKKTIEGFLGGLFFSIIAGLIIGLYSNSLTLWVWLIISIIMSIFGTLGDLIQSKFKRQAGVKDSGTIMPGHGGIFDRLDSIIFASPFLYVFLQILDYVS